MTHHTDLVARLRVQRWALDQEAADTIESQAKEIERLREALKALHDQVSLSETWPKYSEAYEAARKALERGE
jgi:hypothetical protein